MVDMNVYLGIDLGGTTCRVGVYRSLYQPQRLDLHQFNWDGDYTTDFPRMMETIGMAARDYDLAGIGIGTAGSIDPERRHIAASSNQHSWDEQPLAEPIEQRLGVPVRLGNDAEAAALGEAYYGAGTTDDFWFVIWGTGIGAAILHRDHDGQPHVQPTELGHAIIDPDGPECLGCEVSGCVESLCGGRSLEHRFGLPAKELTDQHWNEAEQWMARFVYNLSRAHVVPLVVMGGGISGKQPDSVTRIEALTKSYFHYQEPPRVVGSTLQEEGGLLGALSFNRHQFSK